MNHQLQTMLEKMVTIKRLYQTEIRRCHNANREKRLSIPFMLKPGLYK